MNFVPYENVQVPDIEQIYAINDKQSDELDSLIDYCSNAIKESTMDIEMCEKWEKICDIPKSTISIENRRKLISLFKNIRYHMTLRSLNRFVKLLTNEKSEITLEGNSMRCVLIVQNTTVVYKIIRLFDELTPCHLLITYEIGYKTYKELTTYTHEQLSAYTYEQMMNDTGSMTR